MATDQFRGKHDILYLTFWYFSSILIVFFRSGAVIDCYPQVMGRYCERKRRCSETICSTSEVICRIFVPSTKGGSYEKINAFVSNGVKGQKNISHEISESRRTPTMRVRIGVNEYFRVHRYMTPGSKVHLSWKHKNRTIDTEWWFVCWFVGSMSMKKQSVKKCDYLDIDVEMGTVFYFTSTVFWTLTLSDFSIKVFSFKNDD